MELTCRANRKAHINVKNVPNNKISGVNKLSEPVLPFLAFCPDETTELLRGNYNWAEIEADMIQNLPCEYNINSTGVSGECDIMPAAALRRCNGIGQWEEPDVTECVSEVTATLCSIRNVREHRYI